VNPTLQDSARGPSANWISPREPPGLTGWLVAEDVSTDPMRRQQIAREIANLVVAGFGVPRLSE
jgi:hypothetical protein